MDSAIDAAQQAASSVNPGDKYIGLSLAISSSALIGTSFIITKKGLISAADNSDGYSSESYAYLRNATWWAGMITIANFAAYTFAPAILVTPLGAMSVLVGAVLASFFLGESLGKIGIAGCSLCLVGSLIIVLHAPEDRDVATVDELLEYALQPGFMLYCLFALVFCVYMIYKVAPHYGQKNPLVYISICSVSGSVSVMAIKGFGVALKLTLAGHNQLWRAGTWIFAFTVAGCIAVQMNFFTKALDVFPTTVVNPLYFSFFSSATLLASIILFRGLNTSGAKDTLSLLAGLYIISLGVYLLNLSRSENESQAARRHSSNGARHSLLGRSSESRQGGRLSMASDSDLERGEGHHSNGHGHGRLSEADARNSTSMYRAGGVMMGGAEPLFDYEREGGKGGRDEEMRMERFALTRNDEDEDGDADGEDYGGSTPKPPMRM
ncbi:hypothetical protein JCM6882_002619 [Rhodosporidiobolus microsporus]